MINNLKNSFPEKSEKEINAIAFKFYRHLCDIIVESLKNFSITGKRANKLMKHNNVDIVNAFFEQGKNVAIVGGHYGNWELFATTIDQQLTHQSIALFTPLKNQFFNKKMKDSRSKFGLQMLSIFDIKKKLDHKKELAAIIFGADQSPRKAQRAYWMTFLNQDTGVQFGTEKTAVENNMAVVFGRINRIKRGKYETSYEVICEDASTTDYGFITETHTKLLEKDIIKRPELWLWSHKRWKHKRPESV